MRKLSSLAADYLVQVAKMIFAEYGLSKSIVSEVGHKFNFRSIQIVLQADEHPGVHNHLTPPQQWPSGGMHIICKTHD